MCRRLLDAVGVLTGHQPYFGAEATAITSSEYLPLADGNSETCSVDGAHIWTLNVVPH